jgi:hypothetical protein
MSVAVAALPGCAPRSAVAPTTLVPLLAPNELPTTTEAPTTTVAPSSDPSDPLLAALPEGECAYADALPGGELTFIVAERLYGVAPEGTAARCLSTINGSERGPVRWSARGERALLNSATTFDADGRRDIGYLPENLRVRWVHPTASALIAPTASNRTLVRREAANAQRSEVTFLAQTEVAISHPAGGSLIAAGTAFDGTRGIYVASDLGANPRPIVRVDDADISVTELAMDADGASLLFVTGDTSSFSLRRVTFPELAIAALTTEQSPIAELVTGPVTGAAAWRVGLCNSVTDVRVLDDRVADPIDVGDGTPIATLSLSPLGWLDVNRLVVAARPLGCDGPADVWIWNRLDNAATLVVKAVDFPSVRVISQAARTMAISPAADIPVL